MTDLKHQTFVFERRTEAKPDRVFAAFADPNERERWSAPSDTASFVYEEAEFREGGSDIFRCGSKEAPQYSGRTHYLSIIPLQMIVSSEVVVAGGQTLMISLITTEIADEGPATRIRLTVQATSFMGDMMLQGVTEGNNASLDNLVSYLAP